MANATLRYQTKSSNNNPVNPIIGGYPDMAYATLRYQTICYNWNRSKIKNSVIKLIRKDNATN